MCVCVCLSAAYWGNVWPGLNKILKGEGALPSRGPILTQEGTRIINIVKQLITDMKI